MRFDYEYPYLITVIVFQFQVASKFAFRNANTKSVEFAFVGVFTFIKVYFLCVIAIFTVMFQSLLMSVRVAGAAAQD